MKDNTVRILEISDSLKSRAQEGALSWTMIYDEGFEIKVGSLKMFHFSYYQKIEGTSVTEGKFQTNCAKTLLGWTFDSQTGNKGCSYGYNVKVKEILNKLAF